MSGGFADHFSVAAARYGAARPSYPDSLYELLAARAPGRALAWDCATGSGQALDGLCRHFERVVASDASLAQLAQAERHPRVLFIGARAERVPLAAASVDLVTVAQALHWFDLPAFFAEVARVLRPGGLLAAWTYNLCGVTPEIDRVIGDFYRTAVGDYWPQDRRQVEQDYAGIVLPWDGGETLRLRMEADWDVARLGDYVDTWSAVTRYRAARGDDPLPAFRAALRAAWGPADTRRVHWPLTVKITRKPR